MSKIQIAISLEYKVVEDDTTTFLKRGDFEKKIGVATTLDTDIDQFRSKYLQMTNAVLKRTLKHIFDYEEGIISYEVKENV